jgi:lysylphosphatidylglycerol synthetase-like protein (DUF2156 family)
VPAEWMERRFLPDTPGFCALYRSFRLKKLKIGDEALVELIDFSLEGKAKRELRSKVHSCEKIGIHMLEYQPPLPEEIVA